MNLTLEQKKEMARLYDEYLAALKAARASDTVERPKGLPDALAAMAESIVLASPEWPLDAPQPGGNKHDTGKLPLHLLPTDALEAIAEILDFGAKKYAPRNWEKGLDWSRAYRATLGHLFSWWAGAGPDEETGKSHLWHAGCCILFLIAYELRSVGKDDRPNHSS